ncbi:MAG: hypothetical protein ACI4V7_03615 [Succinivibrionaceae bacterium]
MAKFQNKELPQNCYTSEYLEQSGIHCSYSILDTLYAKGPGKNFRISNYIAIFLLIILYINKVYEFLPNGLDSKLLLVFIVCVYITFVFLFRYIYLLRVRYQIRKNSKPILLEPVAIMVLINENKVYNSNLSKVPCAYVYKESGTKKPKFYMSAIFIGVPDVYQGTPSLLYKHYKNSKYYSIDNDYNLRTQKITEKVSSKNETSTV